MKNQSIIQFINKPNKDGAAKAPKTIATVTGTFKRFFLVTGYSEDDLENGTIDEVEVVNAYQQLNLSTDAERTALKFICSYLNPDPKDPKFPFLFEHVGGLIAKTTLDKGVVRSEEEHEKGYAHIDSGVVEEAMANFDFAGEADFGKIEYLQLLAIGIMQSVPCRPSELIQVRISTEDRPIDPTTDSWYDCQVGIVHIHEENQKSKKVGSRSFMVLPYVIEFINKFIKAGLQFGLNTTYLFPSFRKCDIGVDTPVKVGDFTTELVKPITERLTGKALTSRNTRTSVISDKVVDMTPKERMDFAQECGHTLDTQKDAYSVFNPAPKQTIIVNAKKKIEPELKAEVKAEVKHEVSAEYTYENGLLSCKNISMILLDKIIDKLDTVDSCTTNSVSKLWSFKIKLGLRDAHALIKLIS